MAYIDEAGLQEYTAREGWEIAVEQVVGRDPAAAWHEWFARVWDGETGAIMRDHGQEPSRVGSMREVPSMRMTEKIVGTGMPDPNDPQNAVPSISYTFENFTTRRLLGFVRFLPVEGNPAATRVVWGVKWAPSVAGRLFLGGWLLVWALRAATRSNIAKLQPQAT
ncbi:MAG: hypothetical protein GC146_16050 [Limimaricola sp.]|uniref:hypothetical protein n=1 Tax=Limimaricola sp. TaxID=2211665 RepID=UPI001D7AF844|nr:hypothetical protein [Limimaricola sp.]MBI1418729.1 hypothetical protein [Limimaricola sp.]